MENVGGVDQPKRIVGLFYAVSTLIVAMFLQKVLELSFGAVGVNDFAVLGDWTLSTVLGFALSIVGVVVLWRIPKVQTVSLEIALELRRVTWPSFREVRASTIAVIVTSLVASVVLGLFDFVWGWLSSLVY